MPIYDYHCNKCDSNWETFNSLDTRNMEVCCGELSELLISCINKPVILNYYSESLNGFVTGPKQKKELMRKVGVEEN